MGSYGIGVGRALACIAEEYSDDYGMDLPISVAPYQVILISLGRSGDVMKRPKPSTINYLEPELKYSMMIVP